MDLSLLPKFSYDKYQDVRYNLAWWSTFLWAACFVTIHFAVLPPSHRAAIWSVLPAWITGGIAGVGLAATLLVLAALTSLVLVEYLKIHDSFYDRYIVKWRADYDAHFIIPGLLRPYAKQLPLVALAALQDDGRRAMESLYYKFVGDEDMRIRKNLVVRFYEVAFEYWMSQLLEFAALLVAVTNLLCAVTDHLWALPVRPALYWTMVGAIAAWVVGRLYGRLVRRRMRAYTQDEIDAIHVDCGDDFKRALTMFLAAKGINVTLQ